MDCIYRRDCPKREETEAKMMKRNGLQLHCSYNEKMFECEEYQRRQCPEGRNPEKIYNADYL